MNNMGRIRSNLRSQHWWPLACIALLRIQIQKKSWVGWTRVQTSSDRITWRTKIYILRHDEGLRKGKFSAEEVERMKQALANNEDYKHVAAELSRQPMSVRKNMLKLRLPVGRGGSFSIEEDLCILDKAIDRLSLKFTKL